MFYFELQPRFNDTDALGHISNTTLPIWFEQARTPLFQMFNPTLDVKTWPLIIARVEIDFVAQSFWHLPVEIRTGIGRVGNSSFQAVQEAWQDGKLIARGKAVLIHFDYKTEKAVPISEEVRSQLAEHTVE